MIRGTLIDRRGWTLLVGENFLVNPTSRARLDSPENSREEVGRPLAFGDRPVALHLWFRRPNGKPGGHVAMWSGQRMHADLSAGLAGGGALRVEGMRGERVLLLRCLEEREEWRLELHNRTRRLGWIRLDEQERLQLLGWLNPSL